MLISFLIASVGTLWADRLDEPPLEVAPEVSEEDQTVEVPIEYLRHALWYYEMYFVYKDVVEQQDEIIAEWESSSVEFTEQLDKIVQKQANLQLFLKPIQTALWIAIGYLSARTVIDIIATFLGGIK